MSDHPSPVAPAAWWLTAGDLTLNLHDGSVLQRGAAVEMSSTEGRLLAALAGQLDQVIPARILVETLWGTDSPATRAYLHLYVRYLRQKLEDDPRRPRRIRGTLAAGYQLVSALMPAITPVRSRRWRRLGLRPASGAL